MKRDEQLSQRRKGKRMSYHVNGEHLQFEHFKEKKNLLHTMQGGRVVPFFLKSDKK